MVDDQVIDVVLVFKSDRFSRGGIEELNLYSFFQSKGVALLSVTEGFLTANSLDDEFMSFVRAGLNMRERKLIGLRTRQALQHKLERGEPVGRARYGWKYQDKRLVPVPQEQEAISRMKALQAKGYTTREIVQALKEEGIRTRKGTWFSQTQVCRILRAA